MSTTIHQKTWPITTINTITNRPFLSPPSDFLTHKDQGLGKALVGINAFRLYKRVREKANEEEQRWMPTVDRMAGSNIPSLAAMEQTRMLAHTIAQNNNPKFQVEVFGSFMTALFLPSSDVDMVILESRIRTPQMGLVALSRALSQSGVAKKNFPRDKVYPSLCECCFDSQLGIIYLVKDKDQGLGKALVGINAFRLYKRVREKANEEEQRWMPTVDRMAGSNIPSLAAMEQTRMLAHTIAQNNNPKFQVEVFGSFMTALFLPSSDVDMVILESRIRTPQMGLVALSRALSQSGVAKKVPIIKYVEKRSGISFDVSFDMENGPKAAEHIQDATSKWPPLRPLCLILKVFLQQRELNEVYSGGIGSYALLAMLITILGDVAVKVHFGNQYSEKALQDYNKEV
ncbi:hypothetical protein SSX86_008223 [Deinandra increscens subsp. villosa]|uniref:Poly(A) RNA polymerase mitochondrial-like central palm domain-containing protein n=1 Tax=Deinandra increscens subsp. villosa TaxID=3103831 RepID=A0AAP0DBA6_9ASTR